MLPAVPAAEDASRLTVLVIVDGLGNQFFQRFIAENPGSAIASTLAGGRLDFVGGSTSAFPSYTFPNQVTIATGRWPGGARGHGIMGNEFFDPTTKIRGNTPPTAPADVREYDAGTYAHMAPHAGYVYAPPGLVNVDIRGGTLYEALTAAGKSSFVSFHMVTKGATGYFWPLPQDYVNYLVVAGDEGSGEYDRAATDAAVLEIKSRAALGLPPRDHLTLYLSGLDHTGHTETGTAGFQQYLREKVDPQVARVRDALAEAGLLDRVVWIYSADHGHTDMNKDDFVNLAKPEVRDGILEAISCGASACYSAAYEPRENAAVLGVPGADATRENWDLVMLHNGGAAFLHLSDRAAPAYARWNSSPSLDRDVLPFVRGLAAEALKPSSPLYGTMDDVLVKWCPWGSCAYYVYRPVMGSLSPLGVLNPAYYRAIERLATFVDERSPDVVLLPNYLKDDSWPPRGHYLNPAGALVDNRTWFYDRQIEHSTHGSLYGSDSRPVLQIGSAGDALGFRGARVIDESPRNVDVAPTIARLHGIAMGGVDGRNLI